MRSSENLRKKIVLIAAAASFAFAGSGMVYAEDMTWEEKQNAAHKEELVKSLSEEKQRGDINGDGVINVFDVMRYKSGILEGNYFVPRYDDIDRDGSVNGNDITEVKKDILKKSKIWMYKTMPKMDGSTSAIPLEAGFKSKMLGLNYWDAKLLVEHHKTHESFSMLLSGENDLIFTVPISEEQYKAAETAGVKLNFVPVAKEGFVFVVNKNNPVDSLTSAQIRDIYSGKITNWKEVGGNDEKIIPYQRNKDSGSQNYMTEFMAGYDLMDPPKDFVRGEMSTLMDSIAFYDNAVNAIGYSVYSYAAQMYENSSDTKFIAVDGIKPSKETMADGTYPLLSSTSIVYTDKASQNTKDFADWAVSEEGQKCVMDSGYIPLKNMEYPENMKLYSAKGTGKEKPADYKPAEKYSHSSKSVNPEQKGNRDDKELYKEDCLIDFLKDKDFEKKINKDLDDIVFQGKDKLNDKWRMKIEVINGFMNITFYEYDFKKSDTTLFPDSIITLNYDLKNKRRIEKFSDLFYKDNDFTGRLNDIAGKRISRYADTAKYLKNDFVGLLGECDQFRLHTVVISKEAPYFDRDTEIFFDESDVFADDMVTGEYFDNSEVVDIDTTSDVFYNEWNSKLVRGDDGEAHTVLSSRYHTDEEVAEKNRIYEKVYEQAKALRANDEQVLSYLERNPSMKMSDVLINLYYPMLDKSNRERYKTYDLITIHFRHNDGTPSPYKFDPYTGDPVMISDILGEKFKKYDGYEYNISSIDFKNNTVTLYKYDYSESVEEKIDPDEINHKY
ncbi:MAG: substrate-binding domain-containing protein, partial [Oscillospiraceae bacterium]|nr:substrate-binding domain-containing protein [Oscillospiraceae bacterium]